MSFCPGCDGTKGCYNICGGPGPADMQPVSQEKVDENIESLYSLAALSQTQETVHELLKAEHVRIEKIVSTGQSSPEDFWYDQNENEWVCVLKGKGVIGYEDGSSITLETGQSVNIPAHKKHRVTHTDNLTIWLAVFY